MLSFVVLVVVYIKPLFCFRFLALRRVLRRFAELALANFFLIVAVNHIPKLVFWYCQGTLPIWDDAQGTVAKCDTPCRGVTKRDTLLGVSLLMTPLKKLCFFFAYSKECILVNGKCFIIPFLIVPNSVQLKIWQVAITLCCIHTDAIKSHLIPSEVTPAQASIIYAEEADVLNVAMFGIYLPFKYGEYQCCTHQ